MVDDTFETILPQVEKGENPTFDQESLELTCLDLFKAGAETTSTTLLWCILKRLHLTVYKKTYSTRCILYLTRYQDVQETAREEVEKVLLKSF